MTQRFSLEILADDAPGGCLRADLHGTTLSVAASFRLDPLDPGAQSMLESLNGKQLEFSYCVRDFDEQRYLTAMQRSIEFLYAYDGGAFRQAHSECHKSEDVAAALSERVEIQRGRDLIVRTDSRVADAGGRCSA